MPTTKQMSKTMDAVSGIASWALETDESTVLGFATYQDEESGKTKQSFSLNFPGGAAYRSEDWDEVISLSEWLRGVVKTEPVAYKKVRAKAEGKE